MGDMANGTEVDDIVRRSTRWPAELAALRTVLLATGLREEVKWGKPCYTHGGSNVAVLQEMKDVLALMFFRGALLADPYGVLEEQGPNSRSARRICFRSVDDVERLAAAVGAYVSEAIGVTEAGLEVAPAPEPDHVDELRDRLARDDDLRAAFEGLTPGRRREYHLYFSGAKKPVTRAARVERCVPRILAGKGLRDR